MADSDHNTTLPFVTSGRKAQRDVAAERPSAAIRRRGQAEPGAGHVLAATHAWHAARATTRALCRKQQQLETQLADEIGFPPASVRLLDGTRHFIASFENLRETLGQGPFDRATQETIDHWARWHERDVALGYSAVKTAEQRAANDLTQLFDELARTPASSLTGVVEKLTVLALAAEDNAGILEAAVPQIRSVLEDLKRIAGATSAPNKTGPQSAAAPRASQPEAH